MWQAVFENSPVSLKFELRCTAVTVNHLGQLSLAILMWVGTMHCIPAEAGA